MKCVGTPTEVKRNYGSPLLLKVIFEKPDSSSGPCMDPSACLTQLKSILEALKTNQVLQDFEEIKKEQSESTAQFALDIQDSQLLEFFRALEEGKEKAAIGHFEISQTPLKDVFERVVQ